MEHVTGDRFPSLKPHPKRWHKSGNQCGNLTDDGDTGPYYVSCTIAYSVLALIFYKLQSFTFSTLELFSRNQKNTNTKDS